MSCWDAGRSRLPLCRTIPLVIGLLVTMAQGTAPEQQENLMEMISVELEASMQSSVLSELQAASSSVGEGPPTALPDCSAKNGGVHSGIPDSSAIAGQVFQLKVPQGFANATCNVHVSAHFHFCLGGALFLHMAPVQSHFINLIIISSCSSIQQISKPIFFPFQDDVLKHWYPL